MNKNYRRARFFANRMHRELFLLVFLAAIVPMVMTSIFMYFLIFNVTADQIGFPEAIARNVFPAAERVGRILTILMPVVVGIILMFAYEITHRTVGPFDRIVRELDEIAKGERTGNIKVRKNDKFWPLVDKINALLSKR